MDNNTRDNYKPYGQVSNEKFENNKSEKLIDIQAPENSLVLTPLMSRKEVSEMFYEWVKNTYGEYFLAHHYIPTWKSAGDDNTHDLEDRKVLNLRMNQNINH